MAGRLPPIKYQLIDNEMKWFLWNNDTIKYFVKVISAEMIYLDKKFNSENTDSQGSVGFRLYRIPSSELTFSKVKCWKEVRRKNVTRISNRQKKYHYAFLKRSNEIQNR